ncbi:hypothetical protein [Arthrobacter sp. ISL-65]|uniref:hypothetical protein n=1 Tax=Arthrobacter sp. ISL-65 TaxID=2819112 RepID=UPI002035E4CC|nr:hypothetical protein [Arthrobacter sp. ISL-65]
MTANETASGETPRRATTADAPTVAQMLHDFNTEFATPTPGREKIAARLTSLLAGDDVVVLVVGEPATGVAVISFQLNAKLALMAKTQTRAVSMKSGVSATPSRVTPTNSCATFASSEPPPERSRPSLVLPSPRLRS